MAGEQILLDPTSEGTGTQLDITDNVSYFLLEHSYPTPDNDEVWAYSTDTEGERRANTRPKNRTITAKVRCIQPAGGTPTIGTIVSALQGKIGKLNREGGTYKRILPSGDTITFDVAAATIQVPADKQWLTAKKADVTIALTCAPFGRGAPITLSTHTATAKAPLIFTQTGIKGDIPGTGTLLVNNATNTKTWCLYALRSRYYDAGAPLFLEAEDASAIDAGVADPGPTGASGGSTNKTVKIASVGTTGQTVLHYTGTSMPHIGSYRVYARVQSASGNTGTVSLQKQWHSSGNTGNIESSNWVGVQNQFGSAITAKWILVDLGLVILPKVPIGQQSWTLYINAKSSIAADTVYVDWITLVPIDEASGVAQDVGVLSGGAIRFDSNYVRERSTTSPDQWALPVSFQGDYPRIPVAGAEGRTLEVIVIWTGSLSPTSTATIIDATNLDAITATLTYTPRYLVVPAP